MCACHRVCQARECVGLRTKPYQVYTSQVAPSRQGGLGANAWVFIAWELFPYKDWPPLKDEKADTGDEEEQGTSSDEEPDASFGTGQINTNPHRRQFILQEKQRLESYLDSLGLWVIKPANGAVFSTQCEQRTQAPGQVCHRCQALQGHEGLKRALCKAAAVERLPEKEQERVFKARARYTCLYRADSRATAVQSHLKNPAVVRIMCAVTKGNANAFFALYSQALDGQLDNAETFTQICAQFADRNERMQDPTGRKIHGICYSQASVDFCVIMCSYGPRSALQYGHIQKVIGGMEHQALRQV